MNYYYSSLIKKKESQTSLSWCRIKNKLTYIIYFFIFKKNILIVIDYTKYLANVFSFLLKKWLGCKISFFFFLSFRDANILRMNQRLFFKGIKNFIRTHTYTNIVHIHLHTHVSVSRTMALFVDMKGHLHNPTQIFTIPEHLHVIMYFLFKETLIILPSLCVYFFLSASVFVLYAL